MEDGTEYTISLNKEKGIFFIKMPNESYAEKDLDVLKHKIKKEHKAYTDIKYKLYIVISRKDKWDSNYRGALSLDHFNFKIAWFYIPEEKDKRMMEDTAEFKKPEDPDKFGYWTFEPSGPNDIVKRYGGMHVAREDKRDLIEYTYERYVALKAIKDQLEILRQRLSSFFAVEDLQLALDERVKRGLGLLEEAPKEGAINAVSEQPNLQLDKD
jgi:hypothetical protein